jgi:hypothetical protein
MAHNDKQLTDAEVQKNRDALTKAQLRKHNTLRAAVHVCLAAREELSDQETGLVKSSRSRLKTYLPLTAAQQTWLLDIARRSAEDVAEEIDRLVQRWANGNADGEHPTYPRSNWPLRDAKGLPPTAYWHWALSEIERNGGNEEHCDECGAQLDGDGWDGLCGNCADRVESGEVTREELHM